MKATGSFDITLEPQAGESYPVGRMQIDKTYTGDLVGTGTGQMISKRTEAGDAVYSAIEEFEGSIQGKSGGCTFFHIGRMSTAEQTLDITIVSGSGTGELVGIEGLLSISQEQGSHHYELEYTL